MVVQGTAGGGQQQLRLGRILGQESRRQRAGVWDAENSERHSCKGGVGGVRVGGTRRTPSSREEAMGGVGVWDAENSERNSCKGGVGDVTARPSAAERKGAARRATAAVTRS